MDHKDQVGAAGRGIGPQDQGEHDALQQAPTQGHIAGDLGDLAPPGLALILLEILQLGQGGREQLQDDRGVDEGQDAQAKHPQGGDAAAGEDVEEANQLAALGDEVLEGEAIDAGHGDVDPQAHQQQQAQGDEHPVAQGLGLDQLADDFPSTGISAPAYEHGDDKGWGREKGRRRKKTVCPALGAWQTAKP